MQLFFHIIGMVDVKQFYFNPLRECTYIVWDESSEAVIIDPGCHTASEEERVVRFIAEKELKPVAMLLTHGHFDHVMGVDFVDKKWHLPLYMNRTDVTHMLKAAEQCRFFRIPASFADESRLDIKQVSDGDSIKFGNTKIEVLATPGHTAGGVCYYISESGLLFSGDTLFEGRIGRTALEGGNFPQLIESIQTKLLVLPDAVKVFPGHGYATTIEEEKAHNPYL